VVFDKFHSVQLCIAIMMLSAKYLDYQVFTFNEQLCHLVAVSMYNGKKWKWCMVRFIINAYSILECLIASLHGNVTNVRRLFKGVSMNVYRLKTNFIVHWRPSCYW